VKLRLLCDRVTLELFANDGAASMTSYGVPEAGQRGVEVFAEGGEARLVKLIVHELKSAW
jgi:sucrose-6-phosphate hydrolase SacC (GH32 family)